MIEELKGKKRFFQTDDLLYKYFLRKELNDIEKKKMEEFRCLAHNFSQKLTSEDNFYLCGSISYLQDYGYYSIGYGDRGYYFVDNYGEDVNEAFKKIIIDSLFLCSIRYEVVNRKELQLDYLQRFGNMEYFQCLYFAEYSLKYWDKFFDGEIPSDIIDYYIKYLNDVYNSDHFKGNWKFDFECKLFDFQKKHKVRLNLK